MKKVNVAVIFGGTNTEHEVSIVSAKSVIDNLDPAKFNITPIYITKRNQWAKLSTAAAAQLPTTVDKTIVPSDLPTEKIDVIFPVLHGPYGEDGTIQGMLEMFHLPYVGCGVLGSALCMDKIVQKQLCLQQGLPVTQFAYTTKHEWESNQTKILQYIQNKLSFPLFIKPANQGSSVGIIKAHNQAELIPAINQAFEYDSKVLIEQGVDNVREIECAILGNADPKASVLGEIIPSNEFYDYDAKYVDGKSDCQIPANLPNKVTQQIQDYAIRAFKTLNCSGLARVDFLVNAKTLEVYLNELNTMPGFTTISMYPKLWQASGLSYSELLEKLIELGIEQHNQQMNRKMTYDPKLPWYQT